MRGRRLEKGGNSTSSLLLGVDFYAPLGGKFAARRIAWFFCWRYYLPLLEAVLACFSNSLVLGSLVLCPGLREHPAREGVCE